MASFPSGWFNTYPQTQPSRPNRPTQPEPPPADPLQLVIMGLINLGLGLDRGKSRKIPKVGKQKQTELANKQRNKNPNFPNTGKSKKSKASNTNTSGGAKETAPKECIFYKSPHSNLMLCPNLTQYLPSGRYQPTPVWPCLQCLSTKHWNAKNCNHMGNRFYKKSLCPRTKKSSCKAYKGPCIA